MKLKILMKLYKSSLTMNLIIVKKVNSSNSFWTYCYYSLWVWHWKSTWFSKGFIANSTWRNENLSWFKGNQAEEAFRYKFYFYFWFFTFYNYLDSLVVLGFNKIRLLIVLRLVTFIIVIVVMKKDYKWVILFVMVFHRVGIW